MSKFNNKIIEIEEALSFSNTFKAPDIDEKEKRLKEVIDERLAEVNKTKLPDGTWHVHGDLDFSELNISSLKILNISIVDGFFSCTYNDLKSLIGCPTKIGKNFYCNCNNLSTLEGCPTEINGGFYCNDNKLTTLEGCPRVIEGDFSCSHNSLTTLKGCPQVVKGDFSCSNNLLSSLLNGPKIVDGDVYYSYNKKKKFNKEKIKALCKIKGRIYV